MNGNNIDFLRKITYDRLFLIFSISIYIIVGLILIQDYLFVINTDGISYIHIAQNYIDGRFSDAINGLWSPLFSWFLIPFLMIGDDKIQVLFSLKLISLIIGIFTFIGVYLLCDQLKFDNKLKIATLVTLIPFTLYFAFNKTTPDLLVLTILIFYLRVILDKRYLHSLKMGLLAGFLGALAYLAKSYVFAFFSVQFVIINIDYWLKFKKNRKIIMKNFILGLVAFLCISGIWVGLISDKYDKLTIGTASTFNYGIFGPQSPGPPIYYDGLMKPQDDAMSVWDDPSYIKVVEWSPFSSIENFDYQLQIISYNLVETIKIIESFSILSILIILLAFFLINKSSNDSSKNNLTVILLTIFIYSAGYCFIFVEIRYLWFVELLLLLLGVLSIKVLFEEYSLKKNLTILLVFLMCFSFIPYPVFNLYDTYGDGKDIYNLAENLKKQGIQGGNIAASSADWRDTLILSYYLNSKYFGLTKPSSTPKEISEELHKNEIKYYIWWHKEPINIQGYEKIKESGFSYPIIYGLKAS